MRTFIPVVAALAFCACNPAPPVGDGVAPAAIAGETRSMVAMSADAQMSEADDDSITTETPDGFTFHTSPAMVERVRLPTTAEYVWTATVSDTAIVTIGEASNEFELGLEGPLRRVIKVTPKAAGKTTVTFERRKVSSPNVIETRSIHFMVH